MEVCSGPRYHSVTPPAPAFTRWGGGVVSDGEGSLAVSEARTSEERGAGGERARRRALTCCNR